MDKFNEQYTDYTSTAPSDECRHCGRVDNQWTIKVDNSDKLKSDLRKLVERWRSMAIQLDNQEISDKAETMRVDADELENLLKGGE